MQTKAHNRLSMWGHKGYNLGSSRESMSTACELYLVQMSAPCTCISFITCINDMSFVGFVLHVPFLLYNMSSPTFLGFMDLTHFVNFAGFVELVDFV